MHEEAVQMLFNTNSFFSVLIKFVWTGKPFALTNTTDRILSPSVRRARAAPLGLRRVKDVISLRVLRIVCS